jgi:O-antigen biosynthesis protein
MKRMVRDIVDYFIIRSSGFFNKHFYLQLYPDIHKAGIDPLMHYVKYGWKEGRNPSSLFDTRLYLEMNADVKFLGINPLVHYLKNGRYEGRIANINQLNNPRFFPGSTFSNFEEKAQKKSFGWLILDYFFDGLSNCKKIISKLLPDKLHDSFAQNHNGKIANSIDGSILYAEKFYAIFSSINMGANGVPPDKRHLFDRMKSEVINSFSEPPIHDPIVTIIIPTFNHVDETIQCLYSIARTNENTKFEIIIADDQSADATVDTIQRCKGIRLIKNPVNLGFLRNCNNAAKEAHGQFLMFLNNDTVVLPGWVDNIVETFQTFPEAGLVGSELLYPNGRLQEAGSIMHKDGTATNYGKYDDPQKPQYNYLREVDYCSGASIMIRHSLWKILGGFSEEYAPAYYEDTDLAFRVRQAGFLVFYQPLSKVFHLEGITSGNEIVKGVKQYQEKNRGIFAQRWEDTLRNYSSTFYGNEEYYRNRFRNKHALVIDACTPTPDQDSGSIDAYHHLMMLSNFGFEVSFIPESNFLFWGRYTEGLQKKGIQCLYHPYIRSVEEYLSTRRNFFDLILLSREPVAEKYMELIQKNSPESKIIFNTVDLHFLREERAATIFQSTENLEVSHSAKEREISLMRKADQTILVSDYEAELIHKLAPDVKTAVIPLPREIPGRSQGFEGRKDILFIGGYSHPPNLDAVYYFVQNIWPIIHKELPDCKFLIAGSNMPEAIKILASDEIIPLGFLASLDDLFNTIKLCVAPLRFGAGVKGKVITSLSYGVPCVCTPIAAEGIGLLGRLDSMIAETPEEFAEEVITIYNSISLWESLSQNGLELVKGKFSFDQVQIQFYRMLQNM